MVIITNTVNTMGMLTIRGEWDESEETSVQKVDEQIDLTGNTFAGISKTFQQVAKQIHEITDASKDIGRGSEEIAASTEEQAAMANEIADSAERLAGLAERLQLQIAGFSGFDAS